MFLSSNFRPLTLHNGRPHLDNLCRGCLVLAAQTVDIRRQRRQRRLGRRVRGHDDGRDVREERPRDDEGSRHRFLLQVGEELDG